MAHITTRVEARERVQPYVEKLARAGLVELASVVHEWAQAYSYLTDVVYPVDALCCEIWSLCERIREGDDDGLDG